MTQETQTQLLEAYYTFQKFGMVLDVRTFEVIRFGQVIKAYAHVNMVLNIAKQMRAHNEIHPSLATLDELEAFEGLELLKRGLGV